MQVAHLLRKYNPDEWGGTETAVKRLFDGLRTHEVTAVAFCPRLKTLPQQDPFAAAGHRVKRFKACVPVWGIAPEKKEALVSVGGNLMSFSLLWSLWREPDISLIHTHTRNRFGGIALTAARLRGLPLVVSIHGGVFDLPVAVREHLQEPLRGGVEWGKVFGGLLRARRVLEQANAVITCNKTEARLLKEKYPRQRVLVQPHGVPANEYQHDHREAARHAFPQLIGKKILLLVGRIDPVKNQGWVLEQAPGILQKFPDAIFVLAGACTEASYGEGIRQQIRLLGLEQHVLLTGGLPPGDPRLIGLFQAADVLILPSISEPFGLVILESWAAGTPVVSSRMSGARELITEGENGWLFDLKNPLEFHTAVAQALSEPELARRFGRDGQELVKAKFDSNVLAGRIKGLYQQLIEEKPCAT
jgi:starch synthase